MRPATEQTLSVFQIRIHYQKLKSLDSSKSHRYDSMSVKIIKNFSESANIALKLMIEEALKKGIFLKIWKKADVVPVHKKEDKTLRKNTVVLV